MPDISSKKKEKKTAGRDLTAIAQKPHPDAGISIRSPRSPYANVLIRLRFRECVSVLGCMYLNVFRFMQGHTGKPGRFPVARLLIVPGQADQRPTVSGAQMFRCQSAWSEFPKGGFYFVFSCDSSRAAAA